MTPINAFTVRKIHTLRSAETNPETTTKTTNQGAREELNKRKTNAKKNNGFRRESSGGHYYTIIVNSDHTHMKAKTGIFFLGLSFPSRTIPHAFPFLGYVILLL